MEFFDIKKNLFFNNYEINLGVFDFLKKFENIAKDINKVYASKDEEINKMKLELENNSNLIDELNKKVAELTEENENYQKVSIHKNLAKQISERDNEIRILNNNINRLNNNISNYKKNYELLEKKHLDFINSIEEETSEADQEVMKSEKVEEEELRKKK